MATSKSGRKRPVESHFSVLQFRQNLQFDYCLSIGVEPMIPGDGTCSRCFMNVYSYTPPNVTEYFGRHRITSCPWCGRSLALSQADAFMEQQMAFGQDI